MLRVLLAKDLKRVRRNPIPWIIMMAIPFLITALIGSIFGPRSGGAGGIGTVRLAIVDEDDTGLTEFLRGFMEQARTGGGGASDNKPPFDIEAEFVTQDEALRRMKDNDFAAAMVIPKGFTEGYLAEGGQVSLKVIKNPAQAIHPRVVEEMLGLLVTALNAVKDLGGDQFDSVRRLVDSDDEWLTKAAIVGKLLIDAESRLEPVRDYLAPPLITYDTKEREDPGAAAKKTSGDAGNGIFAFLLAGMAAMFLLYLADFPMRDLYREARWHTLERFKTLREGMFVFLAGKVLFAMVAVLGGAVILLGGGALLFQFHWRDPLALSVLVLAYACCGAGLMGLTSALAGSERRADILNNVFVMAAALVGGCMFPIENLWSFMRTYLTPMMPTGWFATAVREVQWGGEAAAEWPVQAAKLVALGVVATILAAAIFRRRLEKGVRA